MKKVCLITCHKQPDYIRSKTLRAAFRNIDTVDLIVVKNTHTGLLRYLEVLWKLMVLRITKHPDLYFLTFRGYEILPFVRLITLGKPLVFDEFINLVEWVIYEHHKFDEASLPAKILYNFYRFWLKTASIITTDTQSHARYSSDLMDIPINKYMPLTVSTDEQTFTDLAEKPKAKKGSFKVFYYGSMLPLHGIDTVIKAITLLKNQDIELVLIGGKDNIKSVVADAQQNGISITYKKWVPFDELPSYVQQADICLGGPFGDTVQSQFVITGKTYQFLQMGKPVIIGRNHESEIFTDKKNVLIVEQSNPRILADSILWAKRHPVELWKIGEAGRNLYQQSFSNKNLTEQLNILLTNNRLS